MTMHDRGESEVEAILEQSGLRHKGLQLPQEEQLSLRIRIGIDEGKREKRKLAVRRKRWIGCAAAACLVFLLFSAGIRVSPVFASALREIPGLSVFVRLVQETSDQGVQLAVANEYIQPIGASDEKEGLTFTVDAISADDARLVVFYSVRSAVNDQGVALTEPEVMDSSGRHLQASWSWGQPQRLEGAGESDEEGVQRGTLDIRMAEGVPMPAEVRLRVQVAALPEEHSPAYSTLGGPDGEPVEMGAAFKIDRSRFETLKRELDIHRTLLMEGQRIEVVKATVSPLRINVQFRYDEANSKQVFDQVDMRLTDDTGHVWQSIGGSEDSKDGDTVTFESSYYHKPKALYLEGSMFRALDKDDMSIVINTETQEVLKAPDQKMVLGGISKEEDGGLLKMTLRLKGIAADDHLVGYNLFDGSGFTDAQGREFPMGHPDPKNTITGMYSDDVQTRFYYIADKPYVQPLSFHVGGYPAYIREPYRLQIFTSEANE
ncbi:MULTISPECIES: DUF4179 domain-containing protein [Paenibacillus]|uniref:DUF4179 domain-containing protein n=1 Tax=Paenibacillus TaxID=44249 RepID=UPI0022B91727|nr:DUF4179 domain-containing protein [Paenibacillus caseinilyticus]MCZ8521829.1 DUF4179 domain-containing protein [Paenibacillus caseinilyticus]